MAVSLPIVTGSAVLRRVNNKPAPRAAGQAYGEKGWLHDAFVASTSASMAARRDRRMRPRSSIDISFTRTLSPRFTTSSVLATRPSSSSEIWQRPSTPGKISTKAPNEVVLLTTPS